MTEKKGKNKDIEFAVIEAGGKQYKVSPGEIIVIEKLGDDLEEGKSVVFDKVLLVDDGKGATTIGDPYIKGAKVSAKFLENGRGKKVTVVKYKAKSNYHKKNGHRQPNSKIEIVSIK